MNNIEFTLNIQPVYSEWSCHLFGVDGWVWRPIKGQEPNTWWRFWQFVFFGNKWTRAK